MADRHGVGNRAFRWRTSLETCILRGMVTPDVALALQWLAEAAITPLGPGRWLDSEPPVVEMTDDEVAFSCSYGMLFDEESDPDPVQRVRTALGLLDLTGAFGMMADLDAYVLKHEDPAVIEAFWAGCRARLEVAEPLENLRLNLRTCWLLRADTGGATFAALIGDDVRRLAADDCLPELAHGSLHRRARHVLEDSGTVRWADKRDTFRAASTVVELHPAVFRGLLNGYHAVYGDLHPGEALALLESLNLAAGTEHLFRLRAVLRKGARNHYDDPALWNA